MADNLLDVQGGHVVVESTPVVLVSPAGVAYQTPDGVGQDTANASLASIDAKITALQALVDGLEALAAASTPAGSAIIGKVGIDQTAGQNLVKETKAATGAQTNVASSATDVTILAANANRLGTTIYNDSIAVLYLLLANATSSATIFTLQMATGTYFEVPFGYTGVIKGLHASANGSVRITELT